MMSKPNEIDVLNFVEGRLSDSETAQFLAKLRDNPELAQAVKTMQAAHLPIKEAYEQEPLPPVPEALRQRVEKLVDAKNDGLVKHEASQAKKVNQTNKPVLSRFALAACLLASVGLGALVSSQILQSTPSATPIASNTQSLATPLHDRLVKRIADYQSLYVENTVASLSDTRNEDADALLASIQQRANAHIVKPDFSSHGYEFARAQELGFEGDTLVQLVYRKPGNAPLALCYMPDTNAKDQDLHLLPQEQLTSASWVVNQQHFVLVADESKDVLRQMHQETLELL